MQRQRLDVRKFGGSWGMVLIALMWLVAMPAMANGVGYGPGMLFSDETTKNPPVCYLIGQYSQAILVCYP